MPGYVYTQDEKDALHDLYIKLKELDTLVTELNDCQQDIRDELITDLADGDILVQALDPDLEAQIDFVAAELRRLIKSLHAAEIGFNY